MQKQFSYTMTSLCAMQSACACVHGDLGVQFVHSTHCLHACHLPQPSLLAHKYDSQMEVAVYDVSLQEEHTCGQHHLKDSGTD